MIPLHDDIPTRKPPIVTIAIMAICVLVFLWQMTLSEHAGIEAVYSFGMVPAVLFGQIQLPPEIAIVPAGVSVLTSMFLHGGWLHLGGNMLYLWIFGNNVEDSMGHVRFIIFYLLCGTGAALAQAWYDPASQLPVIGASGAIGGVLGAYILLHPHARVLVLILFGIFSRIVRIPAMWVLGIWFLLQFVSAGMDSQGEGGVAYWEHIGGFLTGMALIYLFRRRDLQPATASAAPVPPPPRVAPPRTPTVSRRRGPWD